jgi:hypothetical protein
MVDSWTLALSAALRLPESGTRGGHRRRTHVCRRTAAQSSSSGSHPGGRAAPEITDDVSPEPSPRSAGPADKFSKPGRSRRSARRADTRLPRSLERRCCRTASSGRAGPARASMFCLSVPTAASGRRAVSTTSPRSTSISGPSESSNTSRAGNARVGAERVECSNRCCPARAGAQPRSGVRKRWNTGS